MLWISLVVVEWRPGERLFEVFFVLMVSLLAVAPFVWTYVGKKREREHRETLRHTLAEPGSWT